MYRSSARLSSLFVCAVAVLFLASSALFGANRVEKKVIGNNALRVYFPTKTMVSTPLRDHLKRPGPAGPNLKEGRDKPPVLRQAPASVARPKDPAVKSQIHPPNMPDPIADFEGQFMTCGCYPPDTNAAVGPDHVWQIVNLQSEVYDKDGNTVSGPFDTNSVWTGFGGPCETTNDGDPIAKYDQLSQRWVISQFALEQIPFLQCFAVSTSSDPLGTYSLSSYDFGNVVNDYPKISIMPEAYYLTVREFGNGGSTFNGAGVVAFDRAAMVAGDPATAIFYDINDAFPGTDVFLAADLQGTNPPNKGSAESIIGIGSPDYDGSPSSVLHFVQMTPNFPDPPSTVITSFDVDVDAFVPILNNIPQPGPHPDLESLPFPMYTPNYRNFGDHDALVFTHDVDAGSGRAGRRWYEVRSPLSDTPTIYQQGTFAPDDGLNRWMGSAALDFVGDIAMGYSVSSSTEFPSIWYTGRLPGDPLGEMSQGESVIIEGSGSQDGSAARWGDYSSMVTDPTDECTFWYTTEYIETTGLATWQTRVGSFKFPSCSIGPTGMIHGTVTDGTNPLAGVKVTANAASTLTNASGAYSFTLPISPPPYDMTASKYGFLPGSANGIVVTDGGDVQQDFVLSPAPTVTVNGVVKDGSGGGWPLYAKIVVTGPGAPTFTLWTDPVTGYYSQTLVTGITYTFQVTAPGYNPGGGALPLAPSALVQNWTLTVDAATCNAPGYGVVASGLFETFDSGTLPPGWTIQTASGPGWLIWSGADPCGQFPGNDTGGSGPYALLNSNNNDGNCFFNSDDDSSLISPSVDLSGVASPVIRFNTDYIDLSSVADVDVSTDGGGSWSNVAEWAGVSDPGPKVEQFSIPSAPDVKARFHFTGTWAWWWQVDNVLLGEAACLPHSGGLVVGNVVSTNTGAGLNGATVENLTATGSTKTFATPADPNQPDGLYILFSESGPEQFKASYPLYSSQQKGVTVIPNSTVRLDFSLASGLLSASPSPLSARVDPGQSTNQTLTLTNTGSASANFTIYEINTPPVFSVTHGFASQDLRQAAIARLPNDSKRPTTNAHGLLPIPNAPTAPPDRPLAAGDVLTSFPLNLNGPWGPAYDLAADNVWVSDILFLGGNNYDYQYLPNGTATGNIIDNTSWLSPNDFAADGTYNQRTGMLWQVHVGGDECIYELDPVGMVPTGNKICPNFGLPFGERGLAYDFGTDTYYSGSWEDGVINHFDGDGNILDSKFVGMNISGLAFYAASGHLFVMVNNADEPVTVLDARNNYAVIGSFQITENGANVFGNFAGAGIEADCAGNLWLVNQTTGKIYKAASGEPGTPGGCSVDIPWLSENPTSGTVAGVGGSHPVGASNTFPVTVTFDAGTLLPGLRQAQLTFATDTPTPVAPVAVDLTIRFLDVPDSNQFQAFIYGAAGAGVMMGGTPVCSDSLHFCPDGVVTRADMAGYIFRAVHGRNAPPPVYLNIYGDVSFNDYNAFYIQGITDDGITVGCGNGNYCPDSINTRAQMSVFIWKGQHGSNPPPACTPPGIFADVPCPGGFAVDYIEGLFNENVTAGCGGGNFCPDANISNGQMAVFLVKGFNIPHLP